MLKDSVIVDTIMMEQPIAHSLCPIWRVRSTLRTLIYFWKELQTIVILHEDITWIAGSPTKMKISFSSLYNPTMSLGTLLSSRTTMHVFKKLLLPTTMIYKDKIKRNIKYFYALLYILLWVTFELNNIARQHILPRVQVLYKNIVTFLLPQLIL